MKKADRIKLFNLCTKEIEKYEHKVDTSIPCEYYEKRYILTTKIGPLNVWLELDPKSSLDSLFCRFNEVEKAKKIFGHWKVNIHEHSSETNWIDVAEHLTMIFEKIEHHES